MKYNLAMTVALGATALIFSLLAPQPAAADARVANPASSASAPTNQAAPEPTIFDLLKQQETAPINTRTYPADTGQPRAVPQLTEAELKRMEADRAAMIARMKAEAEKAGFRLAETPEGLVATKTPEQIEAEKKRPFYKPRAFNTTALGDGVNEALATTIFRDLGRADGIRGEKSTALYKSYFGPGPLDGRAFRSLLLNRIFAIDTVPTAEDVAENPDLERNATEMNESVDLVRATRFAGFDGVTLSNGFVKNYTKIPAIVRLSEFLREARQNLSPQPRQPCPQPFFDGTGAPIKIWYTGELLAGKKNCSWLHNESHGFQIVVLRNVQLFCQTCTEQVKKDAGIYADYLLNRIMHPDERRRLLNDR